jgi:hypothetical protein
MESKKDTQTDKQTIGDRPLTAKENRIICSSINREKECKQSDPKVEIDQTRPDNTTTQLGKPITKILFHAVVAVERQNNKRLLLTWQNDQTPE